MTVSETDKVLAGMEIVSWEYKPTFWESECLPQIEQELNRSRAFSPGLVLGAVGGGSLAAYAIALLAGAASWLAAGIAAAIGVTSGAALLRSALGGANQQPVTVDIASVERRALFTSTGVLFGPLARAWTGSGNQLIHAGIERSGTTLRLVFTPSFGPITRLDIPVPVTFEKELPELVRLLELKTPKGRSEAREREISPRPPR